MAMMMILLSVFIQTTLFQLSNGQGCVTQTFLSCTSGFSMMLKVNTTGLNFWRDPATMGYAAESLYVSSPGTMDGPVQVCNAFQLFYACLGPQMIRNCLGPVGLINLGLSPDAAFTDDGIFRQHIFQCGAGFFVADGGYVGCIQNTLSNFNATLVQLYMTYRANVDHDPAGACGYIRQWTQAVRQIYQVQGQCSQMQRPSMAGWYGCEARKEFAIAQFPTCIHEVTCDTAGSKSLEDEMETKVENGVTWLKLPKKWTKKTDGQWEYMDGEWVIG